MLNVDTMIAKIKVRYHTFRLALAVSDEERFRKDAKESRLDAEYMRVKVIPAIEKDLERAELALSLATMRRGGANV